MKQEYFWGYFLKAPAGTYKLVVRVKDPINYRPNIRLAVNGRNADGSFTILSSVVVK